MRQGLPGIPSAKVLQNLDIRKYFEEEMKLYHYTTLDSFCKIWVSKKIRFSDSLKTNDLFEQRKGLPAFDKLYTTKKYHSILDAAKAFEKLYLEELSLYKQISFVMDYRDEEQNLICEGWQSSMMWGQYAHNQTGVCIEIDTKKLRTDNRRYENKIAYQEDMPLLPKEDIFICSKNSIKEYIQANIDSIFFVKHKHWEHENEYRMIKRGYRDLYLSIKDAVTGVYVYSVQDINADIIEQLVPDDIKLYALWVEKRENCKVIDKVDYRYYKKVMAGEIILNRNPQVKLN